MARVTVEDCVNKIPNRFDLILTAASRAKSLDAGSPLTVQEIMIKIPLLPFAKSKKKQLISNNKKKI